MKSLILESDLHYIVFAFFVACDGWKKKYFETKKITASLEEVLRKLQEDLELYYKKLLMQLEAREIKMRPKNLANITDSKVLITNCVHILLEKFYSKHGLSLLVLSYVGCFGLQVTKT